MTQAVDRPQAPRRAAALSAALWLLSLTLPVAHVMHSWQVGGWRMLGMGWGLTPWVTVAWLANPLWLVLTGLVVFGRAPPRWLAGLTAAMTLASLSLWDGLGPGAWVWMASYGPWAWVALTRRPLQSRSGAPRG